MKPVFLALVTVCLAQPASTQGCNLPQALTTGTTGVATQGGVPGLPCNFGNGHHFVGLRWTAPWSGPFAIDTCQGDFSEDTILAVRTPCGSPTAIACSDDFCAFLSSVVIQAVAGVEYEIDVGVFWYDQEIVHGQLSIGPTGVSGTGFCFGDGSGTACPCNNTGNSGRGCGNNVEPRGAHLTSSGVASVGSDTIRLGATGMPNAAALFFQGGTRVANGNGAAFGDGLSCVGGPIVRLGVVPVSGGSAYYPRPGNLPVSVRGMVSAGDVRHYQAWYRDAQSWCTPATFNYTQARTLTWTN